jgi:hypothetical protein
MLTFPNAGKDLKEERFDTPSVMGEQQNFLKAFPELCRYVRNGTTRYGKQENQTVGTLPVFTLGPCRMKESHNVPLPLG